MPRLTEREFRMQVDAFVDIVQDAIAKLDVKLRSLRSDVLVRDRRIDALQLENRGLRAAIRLLQAELEQIQERDRRRVVETIAARLAN